MAEPALRVLSINSGSSSLKFSVYHMADEQERLDLKGELQGIGTPSGHVRIKNGAGDCLTDRDCKLPHHRAALYALLEELERHLPAHIDAIGHRLVHGGAEYATPQPITQELLRELDYLCLFAPEHLPQALEVIAALGERFPELPQIACFDTAFHRSMPARAQRLPLPAELWDQGVRRYGFHGLSYEYIVHELGVQAGPAAAQGRLVIAHLGNGASMAAVHQGRSVDTTMGFTPTGGLVMSSRSGDLDPGVIVYLLQDREMSARELNELLNRRSGLLGISDISTDMRTLLELRQHEPHAALAVEIFCYQARKFIGALAAALGGLDTLVFTGGIGEHAAAVRWEICRHLEFLGIRLDAARNARNAAVISEGGAPCTVRVMATNEDLMIARHCRAVLHGDQPTRAVPWKA